MKIHIANPKCFLLILLTVLMVFGIMAFSYGQSLDIGEPRTVRMIYFLPNDLPFRADVVQKMKDEILKAQTFFAEQMQAHGYGNKTFQFETTRQGEPRVHRVDGEHPFSHYDNTLGYAVIEELEQAFDLEANIYFIVLGADDLRQGNGLPAGGVARQEGKNGGHLVVPNEFGQFTVAHELGHTFGLGHDFRDDSYLMSYSGRQNRSLSPCATEFLSVHSYFNARIPIAEAPPPTVELISSPMYPAGAESVTVRLSVKDSTGIQQIQLHAWGGLQECSGLAGQEEAVVEFEYNGGMGLLDFDAGLIDFTSLSDAAAHNIWVEAVDTDGNVSRTRFILAEISPLVINSFTGHTGTVSSVSFSPDGATFASGSYDYTVKLWEVATGTNIATFRHNRRVKAVSFSPSGSLLASGGNDGIKLWDLTTEGNIATMDHGDFVNSVSFSPSGRLLASGGDNGLVKLWDVTTRRDVDTIQHEGEQNFVTSVSFSPDGTLLASCSWNGVIKLWDVAASHTIATLRIPGNVNAVSFSPDGTMLAIGTPYGDIELWDVATRRNIATIDGYWTGFWPTSISFSPDGKMLTAGNEAGGLVSVWDVTTGFERIGFPHISGVMAVDFSPNGAILASGTFDGTLNLWEVDSANMVPEFTEGSSTTRSVLENTGPGINIGTPVAATDADDDTLTYTLSGIDAASFSIVSASGQLQTRAALDYETQSSYTVTVAVSDGNDGSDSITVTINVMDVSEIDPPPVAGGVCQVGDILAAGESCTYPGTDTEFSVDNNGTGRFIFVSGANSLNIRETQIDNVFYTLVAEKLESGSWEIQEIGGVGRDPAEDWMPDANLRAKVREALELQPSEALTQQVLQGLTNLSTDLPYDAADEDKINNLTGLEHATQLVRLELRSNQISDITPLENLTKLTLLYLSHNQLSDISTLEKLTNLTWLDLAANQLSDISVLGKLTNLIWLDLAANQLSDISTLEKLTNLTSLALYNNRISDISVLEKLTNLTRLTLGLNRISDISVLEKLTNLTSLTLGGNQLSDISVLEKLTNLTQFFLVDTQLSDISVLGKLTNLTRLGLYNNQLSDISVLEKLTNLTWLDLSNNQISDVTPLEDLTALTTLYLAGNPITDYAPLRRLKEKNPNLEIDIDINDAPPPTTNNVPVFTEGVSTTRSVAENTAAGINIGSAVAATDADNDTLTYSVGGTDAAAFSIISTTGQLQTNAALDYETKNAYSVTISVSDGNGGNSSITVTISVTDVNEIDPPPVAEGVCRVGDILAAGESCTYPGTDTEFSVDNNGNGKFIFFSGANSLNIRETQINNVSYTLVAEKLEGGSWKIKELGATAPPPPTTNSAPVFTEGISTTRSVAENTAAGINIGTPVAATDADNDTLTYSVGGTDAAAFSIISTTGQLQTNAALDYETKNAYSVTVSGSDGNGGSSSITVTISVTDVNEIGPPPVADGVCRVGDTLAPGESCTYAGTDIEFSVDDNGTGRFLFFTNGNSLNIRETQINNISYTLVAEKRNSGSWQIKELGPPINRTPVAVSTISAQSLTVGDSAETVNVSTHFKDPDNDALTYTASSNNTSVATVSVSGVVVTITPVAVGSATITVTASDGTLTATQSISVTVNRANRAPTIVGTISAQSLTAGDSAETVNVSTHFKDPDNDALTYTASSDNTSVATVSVSGVVVTITPVSAGSATITVTASDGTLTATQTFVVTVSAQNRAPLAVGTISARTLTVGDSPLVIDVSNNFQDPDGNSLSYTANSNNTSAATVSVSGSQVTITPGSAGSVTITVTASDGTLTATQSVSVTVNRANRAPTTVGTISAQSLTAGDSAETVNVSNHFKDPDNDALTYTASSSATSVATVSVSGSQVTITPVRAGSATITVTASDGELTATQSISVTVNRANRANGAPTIVGTISAQSLTAGGSAETVNVSNHFKDPDNDALTYTASSSATSVATVSVSGSQVTITPVGVGSATITVTASDGSLTATQTIAVTALPVANRAPTTVGTISAQTLTVGGSAGQVDVSGNFQDADNDTLTYTAASDNTSVATASTFGSQITITPIAAGNATITVTADDGNLTATQTISVTVTVNSSVTISITDTNLAAAVRDALGLRATDTITQANILNLTILDAQGKNIRNLTGLEHATNLTNLDLNYNNNISDITPLQNLTKLTDLYLGWNNIRDVTPLQNLTKLTDLYLSSNNIRDVTPLQNLTKLTKLNLGNSNVGNNNISDITPLQNLTELTNLYLGSGNAGKNNISDITPLQNLTKLTTLYLFNNGISDVTPLQNLTELTNLYLHNNGISDVTPLQNLTELTYLVLGGNSISDVTPLNNLTKLTYLSLNYNQITALPTGFFNGFSNLTTIGFTGNPGVPFTWTLTLARTDNADLSTASPATVKVKLAEDAPFEMTVSLSVAGGTLSSTTATIAKGSTESSAITVTQSGTSATTVSLGTAPTVPSGYNGIQTAVGNSIVLFSTGPVTVGTIAAQPLAVGSPAVTVDVSGNFSGVDNTTLEYSASSSNTSVATASVSDAGIVTITPVAAGSATITVTASDGTLSADQTIAVSVSSVLEETWMPDANLRAAVRSALGIQTGRALTQGAMTDLTTLIARGTSSSNEISDLSGLEYATNLTRLFLSSNPISDLTPLKGLTALTQLELDSMPITDLTPLKGLTALTKLNLSRPDHVKYHISDITPLAGLTALTELILNGNYISDLTPLKGLTALKKLDISRNKASDLTPLSGLTTLTHLYLSRNQISDVTPLAGLTALTYLGFSSNQVSDVTPLKGLTALKTLSLGGNKVSDITPLNGLTALTGLYIRANQISDVTPLAGLTALKRLTLAGNQISDASPLESLTALSILDVGRNPISDYAPLKSLKEANSNLNIDIDLTNNIPVFAEGDSTTRTVAENTASGTNIGNALAATDADGDTLTYSLSGTDAASFSIVDTSGQLQTSAALDYETKTSYSVTVTVYDGNSGGDIISVTINVTDDVNGAPPAQVIPPMQTALLSNYPNPFNPETWIPYQLAKSTEVTLTIYNVRGVVVRELKLGHKAAGFYHNRARAAHWDGRNALGEKVASGVYFYTFTAGDFTATRRLLIRK